MDIGYVYGLDSYSCINGGAIHAHNLIRQLTEFGCTIHSFEPESNPSCRTYPQNEDGIHEFLSKIDVLYIRIDGWYLSRSGLKLKCMDQAPSKPTLWEINAPAEEFLKLGYGATGRSVSNGKNRLPEKLKAVLKSFKLKKQVVKEEHFRRRYAGLVNGAICVSENLSPYATKTLGISACVVIPNGSDPSIFSPDKKRADLFQGFENYFKVIYSGDSKWPWQGFDLITDLAAMARSRNHKILFIVLDSSSSQTTLIHDNLLVLSRINYADAPSYIASADACLCLYHDFSRSSYGFYLSPLKLYDYMASARPVIASRLGQIAKVIDDYADGLLTTNDPNDIYDKIQFCAEHKSRAEEIGRAGRDKIVNTYNWRQTAKATLEFITSLSQSS